MSTEELKKIFADLFYHRDRVKKDKLITFNIEEKEGKTKLIPQKDSISDKLLNREKQ